MNLLSGRISDVDPRAHTWTMSGWTRQLVAWGFVMIGGRKRGAEVLAHQVVADKERVGAGKRTTHQSIPFEPTQHLERPERRAGIVGAVPDHRWIASDSLPDKGRKTCVVFDDDQTWLNRVDSVPDPIVDCVNVDGKEVELVTSGKLADYGVGICDGDKGIDDLDRKVTEGDASLGGVFFRRFDPSATPSLHQQESAVALETIFDAEFNKAFRGHADTLEDLCDHSVLLVLGIDLVSAGQQSKWIFESWRFGELAEELGLKNSAQQIFGSNRGVGARA